MTGPTLLQGQWEVLPTCCPFPLARVSLSFGDILWDFDLGEIRSPWQGLLFLWGHHCCTWCRQSCSLNGVQCGPTGTGRGRFLQEPSLPRRAGNGKAKWSFLGAFPAPEELREEGSPPCLELPVPWYLPMSHPTTLLEGLDSSRGFSPWNCLCAVTSEQMRLLVEVQRPRISLTHSFVVLQLGKGDFHARGLGNTPFLVSEAPRAGS